MKVDVDLLLGREATSVLRTAPFRSAKRTREVVRDLPKGLIHYSFPEHQLELRCNADEQVQVAFLASPSSTLTIVCGIELQLSMSRAKVSSALGPASASGPSIVDEILGEYGEWDVFALPNCRVHVEYQLNSDSVRRITFSHEVVQKQ